MDRHGPYRGTVDRLGPKLGQFTLGLAPRHGQVTPALGVAAIGITGAALLAAVSPVAMLVAIVASAGGALAYERRLFRWSGPTVAVHAHGLRTVTDELLWDELLELRLVGDDPWTLSLVRRDRSGLDLPLAPATLVDAIDAIVAPGQRHALDTVLDRGVAVPCGRYHLDRHGLVGPDTDVPWDQLGPAFRDRGDLNIDAVGGTYRVPLATVVNPGALAALINARGRRAITPDAAR